MPGAGKSTAAQTAEPLGFKVFRMGDDVRMEAEKRHIEPTDENLGAIMLQLRQSQGIVAIAHLCKQRIEKDRSRLVLIDGVRNVNEFFEFRKLGKALLVSIHTTPERRFQFLQSRGRSDSPQTFQSFEARDRRELTVGIGEAIALADEVIVNNGSLDELKDKSTQLFKKTKQDFGK
jgi:dephospho-CoA kinase